MDWFNYEQEDKEKDEWGSKGYSTYPCPKCSRHRLRYCENKKHWCEKCYWVFEDEKYFKPDWEI